MAAMKRLLWKLYPSYLLITVVALAAATFYALIPLRRFHYQRSKESLENMAHLTVFHVTPFLQEPDEAEIERTFKSAAARTGARYTLTLLNGTVIGDSAESPRMMENHGDRPEIIEAFQGRTGESIRYSSTLQKNLLYVAIPIIQDGRVVAVIRVSRSIDDIQDAIRSIYRHVILAGILIAVLAALVSLIISTRITRPIEQIQRGAERFAKGDLKVRLEKQESLELDGLARTLNVMAAQLEERFVEIARQRNEVEAILSSMVEGVLAVDEEERIISINATAMEMFAVSAKDVSGKPLEQIIRNAAVQDMVHRSLQQNRVEKEITYFPRSGEERFLQANGTALYDHHGDRFGALVVFNDITRMRRLEKLRRDFVANVSHELRTPITSIKGFLETLMDGAMHDPDHAERFLEIISKHTNRLNSIIDDLLLLSRLEAQQGENSIDDEFHRSGLCGVINSAMQSCNVQAEGKKISFELNAPADVAAMIRPPLIELALVNLMTNAINYSPQGSVIAISLTRADGYAELSVEDHGCGIASNHLDHIFERFYRVDRGRSRDLGGTGLGLAIVKHILHVHKGTVSVRSVFGRGSTFTLRLPEAQAESA